MVRNVAPLFMFVAFNKLCHLKGHFDLLPGHMTGNLTLKGPFNDGEIYHLRLFFTLARDGTLESLRLILYPVSDFTKKYCRSENGMFHCCYRNVLHVIQSGFLHFPVSEVFRWDLMIWLGLEDSIKGYTTQKSQENLPKIPGWREKIQDLKKIACSDLLWRIKTSFILLPPVCPTFSSFSNLDYGFGSP